MQKLKKLNHNGLTLIEIIISLALIGIISITFLTIFTSGFKNILTAGKNSISHFFAQKQVENLIAIDNSGKSDTLEMEFNGAGLVNHSVTVYGKNIQDPNNYLLTFLPSNMEIAIDSTPPVITLLGDPTVDLTIGQSYSDAGATATDDIDGNITANILVNGNTIDTSVIATYIITYDVSDSSGNAASQVIRTVNVSPVVYRGNIEGKVTENVHPYKAIKDVQVYVIDEGDVIDSASTDNQGNFSFTGVPTGTYIIEFIKSGYITKTEVNQVVTDGGNLQVIVQLAK